MPRRRRTRRSRYRHPTILALVAVAAAVALTILCVWLLSRVRRMEAAVESLTRGEDGKSLSAVLETHLDKVYSVARERDGLSRRTATLEAEGRKAFQKLGLVRYNPFEDTGGNQSFALALLDADGDGTILTPPHAPGDAVLREADLRRPLGRRALRRGGRGPPDRARGLIAWGRAVPFPPPGAPAARADPRVDGSRGRRLAAAPAPGRSTRGPGRRRPSVPGDAAHVPDGIEGLLGGLSRDQRRAVTHDEGPLLVVAGAGTGKTQVITRRIAWLIATRRARPSEILALTFTDKAAEEMQERVYRLVPYGYTDAVISTFHAFGDRIFRESALELGLPSDVRVLTRPESVLFLRERLFDFELDLYRRSATRRASSTPSSRSSAGARTRTSTRRPTSRTWTG